MTIFSDQTFDDSKRRWLDTYQTGWFVPNVKSISWVEEIAREHGLRLVDDHNQTPYLRLRALPDHLATFVRAIGQRLPVRHAIVPSMLGSMALQ